MSSTDSGPRGFISTNLIHDPKDATGTFANCADLFLISGPGPDIRSRWTDPETGTFWPGDILPRDAHLMNGCRVWELKMHDLDSELRSFQDCLLLQNFGAGAMNAIDHSISSDSPSAVAGREAGGAEEKRPNNGIIILVAHGLGGILAQGLASLILELPAEILKGHHLGLKRKHWRLLLLGAPNLPDHTNILEDWDQIQGIVSYYGGKGGDVHHTRDFWKGLHQHSLCLIDNGWIRQGLDAPLEPHGTLMVASFREGVEDERLASERRRMWPNDPGTNGFVVQGSYSLFGGKGMCGFGMAEPPNPVLPRTHRNMGQCRDASDPCYLALQAVLKEFVRLG